MSVSYKELSDKAFSLHNQGNLDEAEKLYKILVEMSSEDSNVLNLYGVLCIAKKDYQKAISLLSKAVILSKSPYIIGNLAKAHLSNEDYHKSVKLFQQAIHITPSDDLYYSMAIALKKLGKLEEAAQAYENAIRMNPENYNACYNIVVIYKDLKKYDKAINYANKCVLIDPNAEEIYSLLSFLYEAVNEIELSIKALEKASNLNPEQYLYFYNLGVLYSKLKNVEKSIHNYEKVLELKPENIPSLVNLASLYRKKNINTALGYIAKAYKLSPNAKNVLLNLAQIYEELCKNTESIDILNKLLKNNPKSHEAHSLLAINYMDLGMYSDALASYNTAVELAPKNDAYLHGKAVALKYLGRIDEFKELMQKVLKMAPNSCESKITMGMAYLTEKDFKKGMELYSARNINTNFYNIFGSKAWKPFDEFANKNVLLYSNCGLGDTLMYSRYFKHIQKIAKSVIVQTDKPLKLLIQRNFKKIPIISKTETSTSEFDIAIPIMDIPYALGYDFTNIPDSSGYISPNKTLVKKFSNLDIFNTDKKKVGLIIQGNKKIFKNRSIPLQEIQPLFLNKNIQFYSLQIGSSVIENDSVIDLNDYVTDYNDTAAIIANLDLVISIDSSVLHLAGAMGIKTFLMLPYTPEWRWFNDDKTTPWYDSVTIFKQTEIGDWKSVVARINKRLKKL